MMDEGIRTYHAGAGIDCHVEHRENGHCRGDRLRPDRARTAPGWATRSRLVERSMDRRAPRNRDTIAVILLAMWLLGLGVCPSNAKIRGFRDLYVRFS